MLLLQRGDYASTLTFEETAAKMQRELETFTTSNAALATKHPPVPGTPLV
jgi:hypothetical protein